MMQHQPAGTLSPQAPSPFSYLWRPSHTSVKKMGRAGEGLFQPKCALGVLAHASLDIKDRAANVMDDIAAQAGIEVRRKQTVLKN